MKKIIDRASARGYADHGWLESYHTFSFAGYYNPERSRFGALRALNDDRVAPGEGFGMHPHENMEIVTIPLEGALRHGDSTGVMEVLGPGQIQVMTAGTGVMHSELNASDERPVEFLQIWIHTDSEGHTPRYDRIELSPARCNALRVIVAPEGCGSEHVGWIHQDAWFYTLELADGHVTEFRVNTSGHGVYVFVVEGSAEVADEVLERRDGMGIQEADEFLIKGLRGAHLLLIEVPM